MTRKLLTTLALAAAIAMTSCAARQSTITNLPAGVSQSQVQNWDSAVANIDRIVHTTSTIRSLVITLNQQGLLKDNATYITMLNGIAKVDQYQIAAAQFCQSVPNTWTDDTAGKVNQYTSLIGAALDQLAKDGAAGINDSSGQQQLSQL